MSGRVSCDAALPNRQPAVVDTMQGMQPGPQKLIRKNKINNNCNKNSVQLKGAVKNAVRNKALRDADRFQCIKEAAASVGLILPDDVESIHDFSQEVLESLCAELGSGVQHRKDSGKEISREYIMDKIIRVYSNVTGAQLSVEFDKVVEQLWIPRSAAEVMAVTTDKVTAAMLLSATTDQEALLQRARQSILSRLRKRGAILSRRTYFGYYPESFMRNVILEFKKLQNGPNVAGVEAGVAGKVDGITAQGAMGSVEDITRSMGSIKTMLRAIGRFPKTLEKLEETLTVFNAEALSRKSRKGGSKAKSKNPQDKDHCRPADPMEHDQAGGM